MTRVVLAGGGTAGHTSPMIATAQALLRADPAISVTCVGTPRGLETTVVPAAGLELRLVPPVPLPRRPGMDLARLPWRLTRATGQARRLLREVGADVVVGFGGYASMPVYLGAWRSHVPVVVHEQNAIPGIANKVATRFAKAVLTSFPNTPLPHARYVGLPLRESMATLAREGRAAHRLDARASYGLRADQPVLLVSGGSQGARSLNEAVMGARDQLLGAGVQILHVWGPKNFTDDLAASTDPSTGARYVPLRFVDAMEQAYAAADLMLARSGAVTVTETATVGLPALFVPLPHGNGEQARNAAALVRAGAAEVIADAALTSAELVTRVLGLVGDAGELTRRGRQAQQLMRPGADDRVAAVVLRTAGRPDLAARIDREDADAAA
ncbi:MAG: undecaprenyldiphospho-muramoylpentapeptide beta-N-acetylglucosaminyltransferase [Propionibacteriaceae bacterium]|nr:undecaprenyldiphospho-muramoylpentapeptide beta-N-acetylglucosaminyltransferase [Propionibacteriaceae bacterium]